MDEDRKALVLRVLKEDTNAMLPTCMTFYTF